MQLSVCYLFGMDIITNNSRFVLDENENLLEALERNGYEVAYQCRNGYCGACRVRLITGTVTYAQPPLAYVGADEILPCCCTVTSTSLHVDVVLKASVIPPQKDLFVPELFDESE